MAKVHVKKGDEVVVIAGAAKGRRGKVAKVVPAKNLVLLEGSDDKSKSGDDRARLIKPTLHYLRKSQQNPNGGLLWLEGMIHASNVMLVEKFEARRQKKATKA
jgi:large subunit ribosomal protein L24